MHTYARVKPKFDCPWRSGDRLNTDLVEFRGKSSYVLYSLRLFIEAIVKVTTRNFQFLLILVSPFDLALRHQRLLL